MTAERFLETFRLMGGDAFLTDADDLVLDAKPLLLGVVGWRVDEIGRPALIRALQEERARLGDAIAAAEFEGSR